MSKNILPILLAALLAITGTGVSTVWADKDKDDDDDKGASIEFAAQDVFFEFNSSDLDLGIHIFFDAEAWRRVTVRGPDGKIFEVKNDGGLKRIGSTEVFTESAEPALVDDPEEATAEEIMEAIRTFQARFPEGDYEFRGKTINGNTLVGTAELRHSLPVPVSLDLDSFPLVRWTDNSQPGDPEIVGYEVIVEIVAEQDGEEKVFVNTANFPAIQTSFTTSSEFFDLFEHLQNEGELVELKVEVIATEESGNKTITEETIFEQEE
ncbi:MAG: hypothetical protein EHM23_03020 [Acidobacteria bacterium]|nr:MAG: hypothetical protein EHM23_03020 [Acidobacteriota bacterium]